MEESDHRQKDKTSISGWYLTRLAFIYNTVISAEQMSSEGSPLFWLEKAERHTHTDNLVRLKKIAGRMNKSPLRLIKLPWEAYSAAVWERGRRLWLVDVCFITPGQIKRSSAALLVQIPKDELFLSSPPSIYLSQGEALDECEVMFRLSITPISGHALVQSTNFCFCLYYLNVTQAFSGFTWMLRKNETTFIFLFVADCRIDVIYATSACYSLFGANTHD